MTCAFPFCKKFVMAEVKRTEDLLWVHLRASCPGTNQRLGDAVEWLAVEEWPMAKCFQG